MIRDGKYALKIAESLQCSLSSVYRIAKLNNLKLQKNTLDKEKILALIKEGKNYKEIMHELSCSYAPIFEVARANNIALQRSIDGRKVYGKPATRIDTCKYDKTIIELRGEGKTYNEICSTVGCGVNTVRRAIKRNE